MDMLITIIYTLPFVQKEVAGTTNETIYFAFAAVIERSCGHDQ